MGKLINKLTPAQKAYAEGYRAFEAGKEMKSPWANCFGSALMKNMESYWQAGWMAAQEEANGRNSLN